MRNLIYLFVRFGGLLTFVGLELLCLYLVVNFNRKQNQIFVHSSNIVAGSLYERFNEVVQFWNLSEVSDSLAKKNAQLMAEMSEAKFRETILLDSSRNEQTQQRYTFMEAKVINNSINQHSNNLTINRGRKHGLRPRMGVFDDRGIVGIVRNTGRHYSNVMSILHKECRISAAIRRNNYFGSIVWNGSHPRYVTLTDIPKHAKLLVGDTVQTSGYSTIFPAGMMIGRVDTFWLEPGSNFYTINVALGNDLSRSKYVYVVNDLMREEIEQVEQGGDE
ncbi:MAG: rod shape-determining protein MreC [Bacteroidota bacterium]